MDPGNVVSAYLVSVTLHLLAAVVWIGGLLFIAIIAPTLRKVEPAELRNELFRQIGERFRLVGWTADPDPVCTIRNGTRARLARLVMSEPNQDHTWPDLLTHGLKTDDWKVTSAGSLERQGRRIRKQLPTPLQSYWQQDAHSVCWTFPSTEVAD